MYDTQLLKSLPCISDLRDNWCIRQLNGGMVWGTEDGGFPVATKGWLSGPGGGLALVATDGESSRSPVHLPDAPIMLFNNQNREWSS
jgi:photosystem II stability/assembly factor-like uncharacterized protein